MVGTLLSKTIQVIVSFDPRAKTRIGRGFSGLFQCRERGHPTTSDEKCRPK